MSETTLPELEFENREYELGRIANPAGSSFIVVDGPPKYGKTHLLKKIQEMYQAGEEWTANWACTFVDLANPEYTNKQQAVLDTISVQVTGKHVGENPILDLAAFIAGQDKDVLLLFDAADCAEQNTKWLVQEVIPELVDSLQIPGRKIRVVFAGRYISKRDWAWPKYTTIELTSFDDAIVQRMICGLAPPRLGADIAYKLAREVTFLSGGHPGSISEILLDLDRHHWAIRLDDNGFLHPPEMRKELFGYADHNAKEILEHVPDERIREVLKTLSIFRRFNLNTIQALQVRESLSGIPRSLQPLDMFTRLTNTGLVRSPVPADPFFSDGIVRTLLLVQMRFKAPDRYLALNRLACEIYDAWIESKDVDGNNLRGPVLDVAQVTFMVEGFYHFLHCQARGPSLSDVEEKLQSYIPKLNSAFGDTPEIIAGLKRQLRSSLYGDSDILRRLYDLLSEAKANNLLNQLFSDETVTAPL